jgi:hypothetical protein
MDRYLMVQDFNSYDELVHVFDKNSFRHIISFIPRGPGPGEITNPGPIVFDENRRKLYVSDFGKYKIFSYDLDSMLADPSCMPNVGLDINEKKIPAEYCCINDSLYMGMIVEPVGHSDFRQAVGRWNMHTGAIERMKYEHPTAEDKKHLFFAASPEHGIYAVCYSEHDLISICDLDGNLKYNVYGPKWNSRKTKKSYLHGALFCGDKFFTAYNGESTFINGERGLETSKPTQFLVFNIDGDYLQTLATGYRIMGFCFDRENNRLIMSMDDEIQFAYLDLDGLI